MDQRTGYRTIRRENISNPFAVVTLAFTGKVGIQKNIIVKEYHGFSNRFFYGNKIILIINKKKKKFEQKFDNMIIIRYLI